MAPAEHTEGDDSYGGSAGLPAPVTLALGLVVSGVQRLRDLPALAVQLPIRGVNLAFVVTARVQRQAEQLQERGEQALGLISTLRGGGHRDSTPQGFFDREPAEMDEPPAAGFATDLDGPWASDLAAD